jgi:hypothetical protein
MRKRKSSYLKPYIRRRRNTDTSESLREAIRLSLAKECGFKYVMVQRGLKSIISVGKSKHDLKRQVFIVERNKDFGIWANSVKKICQG